MTDFLIRLETAGDREGVGELLVEAFPTSLELRLVQQLREDGDVVYSLVAVEAAGVIGHALATLVARRFGAAVSGEVPEVDGVHYRLMDTIGGAAVGRRVRRFRSDDEKRRIVAQSYAPGVSVSVVARRYDVNANLIFTWRRGAHRAPASGLRRL